MSTNPFLTTFGLIQRSPHYVEMFRRDALPTEGYIVHGGDTVNNVYGNPAGSGVGGAGAEQMFGPVMRGSHFRSPTLRRKKLGFYAGNRKGQTHLVFDIDDYLGPGINLPMDEAWLFLRVQEIRAGAALVIAGPTPLLGPIYCVPPATLFGQDKPTFTLNGTAPGGTNLALGAIPDFNEDLTDASPRPMHLVFSSPLTAVSITNTSLNNLYLCYGPEQQVQVIAAGQETALFAGRTKEIIVGSNNAAGSSFRLNAVMGLGQR